MPAPKEIADLVERFHANQADYESPHYNETQTRHEFIDRFFECLGWDVDNKQGHAEAYKPVIHEDSIKIGGDTKAPDYCFRIGGTRKFFLEAKKPSVNVKDDPEPAYQLRRYAWSAKLPLSILTNFKELAEPPDELTPDLTIDDKPLKEIIRSLYYPESPYEFSVLPADILGQVYEQFLGKVIRLTPGHHAKIEDKPEVKKAGGVYYTPTYIVDYIVKHTVGKLLEEKTPRQVAKLRILDPASGCCS